jgi:hypothetical protein
VPTGYIHPTKRIINQLQAKVDRLLVAITILKEELGTETSSRNGGNMLRVAELAMGAHEAAKTQRGPYKKKRANNGNAAKMRKLPTVEANGVPSLKGLRAEEAIPLAIKHMKRPLSTGEVTAVLMARDYHAPAEVQIPLTRYVGLKAYKHPELKKTAKGWALKA